MKGALLVFLFFLIHQHRHVGTARRLGLLSIISISISRKRKSDCGTVECNLTQHGKGECTLFNGYSKSIKVIKERAMSIIVDLYQKQEKATWYLCVP